MTRNNTVVPLCQSEAIDDPLTAILRSGARRLLAQAIEAEAETFLATGDGALGFWTANDEVSPTTRHQRCTVHTTANVLDKLPKSVQPAAKADLREIWTAPDRATAGTAITTFAEK